MEGKDMAFYIYLPAAAGPGWTARVYVKDSSWRNEWAAMSPISQGAWQRVALNVSSTVTPPGGFRDGGFNANAIRMLILDISPPSGSTFSGTVHIDAASLSN
jgi:hypothetical protein